MAAAHVCEGGIIISALPVVLPVLIVAVVVGLIAYVRPTRILVRSDAVVVHSAYKDHVFPLDDLSYQGDVPRSIWHRGLIRTFGVGWPLPLSGRFRNAAFGPITIYSVKRPELLRRFAYRGKTLLLDLTDEQTNQAVNATADNPAASPPRP